MFSAADAATRSLLVAFLIRLSSPPLSASELFRCVGAAVPAHLHKEPDACETGPRHKRNAFVLDVVAGDGARRVRALA